MMMLVHLLVWGRNPRSWAESPFSAHRPDCGIGLLTLAMAAMRTESVEVLGATFRWAHCVYGIGVFASLGLFISTLERDGPWLLALDLSVCGSSRWWQTLPPGRLTARRVHSEPEKGDISRRAGDGDLEYRTPNPVGSLGQLAALAQLVYVIDVSPRSWLDRLAAITAARANGGREPFVFYDFCRGARRPGKQRHVANAIRGSLPFLGMVSAMGYELSRDVVRAAELTHNLGEEERRLDLATQAGGLGLWRWDVAEDQVWMNENGRSLFSFAPQDKLKAEHLCARIHPEDRAAFKALASQVLPIGADNDTEHRIVLPDGTLRWLHSRGRVEPGPRSEPRRVHGVSFDITERRLSEEALRESEARFRIVADVAPVMIWMSGTEKEGIFFNKGWLEFTGRSAEEELGDGWLKGVHPEDLPHTVDVCGTAFGKREPFTVEYRLRRKDGEYRWLLDTGTPRFDADGVFRGYIGSCIDIADRKQAELEHQIQSMELARVGRLALMGELAASLAHEINNPLGAMVTNASAGQLMVRKGQIDTDEFQELLGDIVSDGHRAREVIEGIRNMVRKTEPSHSSVEIKDVMRDLVRIVRADALAKKVNLVTEVDVKAGTVLGDRVQLLQVLLNLTINAFEAMNVMRADVRRVVISAKSVEEGTVCLTVRDFGPGLPGGIADRLFEPFFSTKAEGTGMGLAIARSIVEAHRGTLTAENCSDGGARFSVCLPEVSAARSRAA